MGAAPAPFVHVESMQTAVPTRVIGEERRRPVPITVSGAPLTAAALQRRFRVVLYYRGAGGEPGAAARERAAWIKESLSSALAERPEMAGRLLRRGGDGDDETWEVKLNDTGVRVVQASVDTTMAAHLEAKDRVKKEAALALWTDLDVQDPEICAPFNMQLTRFQDGGYAIGVSCSLLLADPLSLVGFLKLWARTHAQLQAQGELVANPVVQYTRYIQAPDATTAKRIKSVPLDAYATSAAAAATTVLFRADAAAAVAQPDRRRALAAACVDLVAGEKPPQFTVLAAGDGSGDGLRVQTCARGRDNGETPAPTTMTPSRGHELRAVGWHELGLEEVVLEGSKPAHVSCAVVSPCADEGLVVVMAPAGGGGAELLISATVLN